MPEPVRILFIGELHSSHALSWIDLLSPFRDEFRILGVHTSLMLPPKSNFPIIDATHLSFLWRYGPVKLESKVRKLFSLENQANRAGYIHGFGYYNSKQLKNIQRVLQEFKPHIVHTLGVFPASLFFLKVLSFYDIGCQPNWIVQARGGPDIALNKSTPALAAEIKEILNHCDCFVADNQRNYSYAVEMGLERKKLLKTGPVPGAGGVDPSMFDGVPLPSMKERLILWPKAYNCIQSDGLAVVEALRLALPRLGEFRLVATSATPDVEYWLNAFLGSSRARLEISDRLPREQLFEIYRSARVLLAPSLSDGVPNSMYEAMASNTVPILSPIDTLLPLFENNVHTIYAPNLDPPAIAEALVSAMNDDALADNIAKTNRSWLPSLAGRGAVRERVLSMYRQMVEIHG